MNRVEQDVFRLRRQLERSLIKAEKEITLGFARQTIKLENELDILFQKYASQGGQISFDELFKYNRMLNLEKQIQSIVTTAYANSDTIIRDHLRSGAMLTYQSTIKTAERETKRALSAIYSHRDVTKTVNDRMAGLKWAERTKYHRNGTILEVEKAVKEGLGSGKTYTEMAKDLTKRLDGEVLKPIRIVRTEGHRVESAAKIEAYEDLEKQRIELLKEWLSSRDERTRSAHTELDGTIIPVDEDFHSSFGGSGKAPGMLGTAEDDINCRCILTMRFK